MVVVQEDSGASHSHAKNEPNQVLTKKYSQIAPQTTLDGDAETIREERRALWKLDLTVIPIVSMFYFLSFLDRANFGNARLAGLQKFLNLSDHQFSVALTVTYVPYIAAEIPANLLLKKLGPNFFLPSIVTIWGLITTLQGFVRGYRGLIVARFFLGLVEGGMFPGIVLYLSSFYTRRELQLRIALFFSSASLSGAFSGLLAYGLIGLDGKGNLPGWAWIFIVEGLFTFFWGLVSFFIFPASIEKSRYLSRKEKHILSTRLVKDRPTTYDRVERFSGSEVLASLKSPHVVINWVSLFMSGTSLYSLAYFQPTIVNSLGYSDSQSQLLSVPPYVVSFVVMLITAYISDRFRMRGVTACVCAIVGMTGFVMFYVADPGQTSLKYGSLFLSVSGVYSTVPPLSAWQSNNSEGHYRRASSIALGFVGTNLGGILSTWIFPSSDKPRYQTGTAINLFFCAGMVVTSIINLTWLRMANARKHTQRDTILADFQVCDQDDSQIRAKEQQRAWRELGDRHPDFTYAY